MAAGEQIGAMYVSIEARDNASKTIEHIEQKFRELIANEEIVGEAWSSNLKAAKNAFAMLDKQLVETQSLINTFNKRGLDTASLERDINFLIGKFQNLSSKVSAEGFDNKSMVTGLEAWAKSAVDRVTDVRERLLKSLAGQGAVTQIAMQHLNQSTMTADERKAFQNYYKEQEADAKAHYDLMVKQAQQANKALAAAEDAYSLGKSSSFAAKLKAQMEEEQRVYDMRIKQAQEGNRAWTQAQDKRDKELARARVIESAKTFEANFSALEKRKTESASNEKALALEGKQIDSLNIAYNRLGNAILDVGRIMQKVNGSSYLTGVGNKLIDDIRNRQKAIEEARKQLESGNNKNINMAGLIDSSYISLYDRRSQYQKDVAEFNNAAKAKAEAEKRAAKEAEDAWRTALSLSLQRNSQRTMTVDERNAFKEYYTQQAKQAEENAKIRAREEKLNKQNHEKQMRLQYKQNQDYNRLVANGKNELNRLYRLRNEVSSRYNDMAARGVDTTQLKSIQQRIQDAINEYKRVLNNVNKADAITILKGGSMRGGINSIAAEVDRAFRADDRAKQIEVANVAQQRFLSGLNEVNTKTSWLGEQFQQLKGYIVSAFAIDQVKQFLTNIVQIGGQLENQRIAIGSILGNNSQANDLFERIKSMAIKSPFGVLQLDQYTKSLTAYGYEYNELYDVLRRLADISAGAGVDMNRLTLAIGHVKAETALTGITLRQFTMANIPMLEMLSKMYSEVEKHSVTVADVRKRISGKQVSYDDVMSVINKMTDEGGRFYDMQNVLSDSLKTKWKNLGDQMDIVYGEMAEGIPGEALKNLAAILMQIAKAWNSIGKAVMSVIAVMSTSKLLGITTFGIEGKAAKGFMRNATAMDATYKNNLKVARSYRMLTESEIETLNTTNGLSNATFRLAVSELKLDKETALRLIALKKLNAEQMQYLLSIKLISKAEMEMALGANANVVRFATLTNVLRGAGAAVKGFIASWGPMVAMFAAFEGFFYIYDKMQKRSERAKQIADEASESYTKLKEKLAEHSGKNAPRDDTGYKSAIEDYITVLKDYGSATEDVYKRVFGKTLKDGAESVKGLKEQYEELKKVIEEIDRIQKNSADTGNIFANADEETGWWFDDTLGENIKDASDAYKEFGKTLSKTDLRIYEEKLDFLKKRYVYFADAVKSRNIGDDIAKQIKLLHSLRFRGLIDKHSPFAAMFGANAFGGKGYLNMLARMESDTEKFIRSIKQQMENMPELGKINWKSLTSYQQNYLDTSYKQWIEKYGEISDDVQKELLTIFRQKYSIKINAVVEWGKQDDPYWKQQQLGYALGNPGAESVVRGSKSYASMVDDVKKRYKELEPLLASINEGLGVKDKKSKDKNAINKSIASNATLDMIKEREEYIDEMLALENLAKMGGFNVRDKIKDKKGSQEDKSLKEWKDLLSLLKQMNGEYKKWVNLRGKEGAKKRLEELGDYTRLAKIIERITGKKIDFSDRVGNADAFFKWAKTLRLNTEQRKKWLEEVQKFDIDENYEVEKISSDAKIDKAIREFDEQKRRYDKFAQLRGKYGDSVAATYSLFGGDMSSGVSVDFKEAKMKLAKEITKKEFMLGEAIVEGTTSLSMEWQDILKRKIGSFLDKNGNAHRADDIIEMTNDELTDLYGDNTKEVEHMLQELRNAKEKAADETIDEAYRIMDLIKTPKMSIARIEAAAKEQRRKLGKDSPLVKIVNALEEWQKFEQTTTYSDIENRAKYLDKEWKKEAFAEYRKKLEAIKDTMTDEEYKKKLDELFKKENDKSGLLFGNVGSVSTFMSGGLAGLKEYYEKRRDGWEAGSANYDEEQENVESVQKWIDGLNNATDAIAVTTGVLNGLSQAAQALSDMYYALGKKSAGDTFSDINDTISGISSILTPANNLIGSAMKGDVSGVISNAISSPVQMIAGPITAFSKLHDKKLQRQVEELQKQNVHLENLRQIMQKGFERALGGIYADSQSNYYSENKASLQSQRENLKKILNIELEKKNSDDSAIEEYEKQIASLDDQLKYYANDMANTLYGIDFKSWSGQLADALVGAWKQGMSAAHAYKDVVTNVLNDVATKVVDQMIIQKAIEPIMSSVMTAFDASGGKIDDNVLMAIEELFSIATEASEKAFNFMDTWEEKTQQYGGTSLKENSTGLAASIAGVTEDTADILGGYINKISVDTGVIRGFNDTIAQNTSNMLSLMTSKTEDGLNNLSKHNMFISPENISDVDIAMYYNSIEENIRQGSSALYNIAMEQLPLVTNHLALMMADIKLIEANTGRSASASEGIYDILERLTNGSGDRTIRMEV